MNWVILETSECNEIDDERASMCEVRCVSLEFSFDNVNVERV